MNPHTPLPWIKLHHKLLSDPVINLANYDTLWIYVKLYLYAAYLNEGGYLSFNSIPLTVAQIADGIGINNATLPKKFIAYLEELHSIGLITTDPLSSFDYLPQWNNRNSADAWNGTEEEAENFCFIISRWENEQDMSTHNGPDKAEANRKRQARWRANQKQSNGEA